MMDDLMRDLQVLWKADSLIGRIWLNVLARRLALSVFAALIAVFGLGMANVAGFYGLQPSYGFVGSAAIVALSTSFSPSLSCGWRRERSPEPSSSLRSKSARWRSRRCYRTQPTSGSRSTRSARTSSKPGTALRASSKIH